MYLDEFNEEFAPFYAEFGYHASGSLSEFAQDAVISNLMSNPDSALAIALEHSTVESYFVRLFWRTLEVGAFECTPEQYNQETVPDSIIVASQNYQPPTY